jgi:hypothetical protein
MLTVVISASDDAQALARLLTALVRGVAEELVGDVVVRGADGLSREVAEDAGASLASAGDFAAAISAARGGWIAGLPLTAVLTPGWITTMAEHVARFPPSPARLCASGGLFSRGPTGWLVPRALAGSAAVEKDLQRLARGRGARRLRVLARG